jgi:hypothetical protein
MPAPAPNLYSIAADSASKVEGDGGDTTAFTFDVTRTSGKGAATINYAVTGEAQASDFAGGMPSGTVKFANGELQQTITISVAGDAFDETDEEFTVTLSGSKKVQFDDATATGTIENDDSTIPVEEFPFFYGEQVQYAYFSNSVIYSMYDSSNNKYISPQTVTVDDSVEVTNGYYAGPGNILYTVDINSSDQIIIDYASNSVWGDTGSHGPGITDAFGVLPDITAVEFGTNNMVGLTADRLTFDANNIYVNWSGLSGNSDTYILINVGFDVVV